MGKLYLKNTVMYVSLKGLNRQPLLKEYLSCSQAGGLGFPSGANGKEPVCQCRSVEYLSSVGPSVFLSIVVQQLVVILVILQEKMGTWPSTPPSRTNLTGATVLCGALSSHCSGFPCCRAQAPDAWTSVVATSIRAH